jgi:hypothetical protein
MPDNKEIIVHEARHINELEPYEKIMGPVA